MEPTPESVATAEMTHADLREISGRLGRVTRLSWATVWATVGILALGSVVGGIYGLISFVDQTPNPSTNERVIYMGSLAVGLLVGVGCVAAAFFMRKERAESVSGIKTDLDAKLDGWQMPEEPDGGVTGNAS